VQASGSPEKFKIGGERREGGDGTLKRI